MTFPQTPLDVRTDLQIGGTWTDVTAETYLRDLITITRGRSDEASRPEPSKCTVTFNNRNGKRSPRNPMGPDYGLFGRNTPIRISLPAAANYLRLQGAIGQNATTPDAAALDILGDIDIRVDATLESWDTGLQVVDLAGKWGADGNRSWRLQLAPGGKLYLVWSPDGTNANALFGMLATSLPVPPSGRLSVRATLDVNNGAGGNTTSFYYSTTAGTAGSWTLAGTSVLTGTTSIFNSTAALEIGDITGTTTSIPPVGKIHAAEVRNGLAGTVVASPVFSTPAAGAASFIDGAGRTWTMAGGAEISNRDYRFHGEVSSWPSKWDVSGKDRYVPVEAAGPLRRYGAGTDPLPSTLRRRIPSDPDLIAYWHMEEGSSATQASSPLAGVQPMATTGFTFAADDTLPGSSALPALADTSSMRGAVPASASTSWHVEFVYNIDTAPAGDANAQFIVINTSSMQWRIGVGATTLHLDVSAPDGTSLYTTAIVPTDFFGSWSRFILKAQPSGGSVSFQIAWVTIGGRGFAFSDAFTGTVGHVTSLTGSHGSQLQGARFGHFSVFDVYDTSIFNDADRGFAGEMAHTRIARLCAEQGVPVAFPGGTGPTAAMGPQRPMAFLDLLSECADADMGILHELREASMLAYRRRSSLYNQPVALALDYAVDGHVAPPLEPVDDDQAARNDITVNRTNGSSARAREDTGPLSASPPPSGIGPVPGGGTFNVYSDSQLPDMAGWVLHLGTWDESRYPSLHVDLSAAPSLAGAASATGIGDRVTIAHPPPEAGGIGDTLDLLAQGYTETLGSYDWDLVYNCTPGGSWYVGTSDADWADTSGSQLAGSLTTTATSLSVATTTGALWTADPSDFPFDITAGGERMTVQAIGTVLNANPTFETNLTDWSAINSTVTRVSTQAHTGSWSALITSGAGSNPRAECGQVAVTAGASYRAMGWMYAPSAIAGGVELDINWFTAAHAYVSTSAAFMVPTVGIWQVFDLKATAPPTAAFADLAAAFSTTPGAGLLLYADDIRIVPVASYASSPQPFTVIRSVNGVVKTHTAGEDVHLARPAYAAL